MSLLSCYKSNMNAVDGFGCSCLIYILLSLIPFSFSCFMFNFSPSVVFLLPFTHSSFTETQTPDSWWGRSVTAHQSNLCNHQHELTSVLSIKHHVVHHTYRSCNICVMRSIRLRVCNGNGHNIIMSGYFPWLRAYKVLAFYSTLRDEWKHVFFYACLL